MLQATVAFDEIVAGATARLAVIEDVQYLCGRDFIMLYSGKSNKQAGQIWSRLSPEKLEALSSMRRNHKFPGKGQSEQPVLTFQGILKLADWIGGEYEISTLRSILQLNNTGDDLLVQDEEERANAEPSGGAQQNLSYKRKREELELAKMEAEMAKMEAEMKILQARSRAAELLNIAAERENEAKHLAHVQEVTKSYTELCADTIMDERARKIFKDSFLQMATIAGPSSAAAVGGPDLSSKRISLSTVAEKLGLKLPFNELLLVGREVRDQYVKKHGKPPPQHEQMCSNGVQKVNTYMEADRSLLEEILKRHVAGKP